MPTRPSPSPEVAVAIGLVIRDGRVLICRRLPDADLPNLWEIPGGKIHAGETPEAAAVREMVEETGLQVAAIGCLPAVTHTYPHARITMTPVVCREVRGDPRPIGCAACRWVRPDDLAQYAFPAANSLLLSWVQAAVSQTAALGVRA